MSTPIYHTTAKIGARVRVHNDKTSYRGVLVGADENHATVKSDDGKRRKVKWTYRIERYYLPAETRCCVHMLSAEEEWSERSPKLQVARYARGGDCIEVDISALDTDEFRAELEALRTWANARPPKDAL